MSGSSQAKPYSGLDTRRREKAVEALIADGWTWDGAQWVRPEGMRSVPIVPTDDMVIAFAEAWYSKVRCIDDCELADAWLAALDMWMVENAPIVHSRHA